MAVLADLGNVVSLILISDLGVDSLFPEVWVMKTK